MGRKPIGSKPMTPAERQRRRRQGISSSTMTRAERTDLAALVRRRERLYKTAAKQRAAELISDFEKQLNSSFSYDDDETWKAAYASAKQAVDDAKIVIAQRCRELSIPTEFAPGISVGWGNQGQQASKERRADLRRLAKTQIDALQAAAITEIEQASVDQQTALVTDGLTSEAAHKFLENMPTAEILMPVLDVDRVTARLDLDKAAR